MLVFGAQEVDLRSQALFVSQGADRAQAWQDAILAGLGARAEEYERVSDIFVEALSVLSISLRCPNMSE